MKTTGKIITGVALISLIAFLSKKKSTNTVATTQIPPKVNNPKNLVKFANPYEGKTVQNLGAKNWWLVKDGMRFGFTSGSAYSNYVEKDRTALEQIQLSDEELITMPEGGFVDETGTIIYQKLGQPTDTRTLCQRKNRDGSTLFYSPMNGTDCYKNDKLVTKTFTGV